MMCTCPTHDAYDCVSEREGLTCEPPDDPCACECHEPTDDEYATMAAVADAEATRCQCRYCHCCATALVGFVCECCLDGAHQG